MKRLFLCILCFVAGLALGACSLWFIVRDNQNSVYPEIVHIETPMSDYANWALIEQSYFALTYIRTNDYDSLSYLVHPEYGLVFSPGATVNFASNLRFNQTRVSNFSDDSTKYCWGFSSTTGEPIVLSASDYFSRYVYCGDFANAPVIGLNTIVRSGNSLENVREVFPGAQFVDFYIPGSSESGTDIGWRILRLVFEKYNDTLRLTAIINSEYTA